MIRALLFAVARSHKLRNRVQWGRGAIQKLLLQHYAYANGLTKMPGEYQNTSFPFDQVTQDVSFPFAIIHLDLECL